jgi:NDP-sugar pyrophosphorylase family protein
MQAVILAGGKGTRLRPFTLQQPKPLLPLLEVPFLEWIVQRCAAVGIHEVLISVGYLGNQIETALGDGSRWGLKIRYVVESKPLDTAGALVMARQYYRGEPLLVFNADILTDLDLETLMNWHQQSKAAVTLTLTRVEDITAYGLVETDSEQRILSFREKPSAAEAAQITTNTINAGTYVLNPSIFESYPVGDPLSFERHVFPKVLQAGLPMRSYVHEGYWRDLGTPASYYQGQLDILLGKMKTFPLAEVEEREAGIWIHPTAEVESTAQLTSPSYVGAHSRLGADAVLPAGTIVGGYCWINRRLEPGVYAPGTLAV